MDGLKGICNKKLFAISIAIVLSVATRAWATPINNESENTKSAKELTTAVNDSGLGVAAKSTFTQTDVDSQGRGNPVATFGLGAADTALTYAVNHSELMGTVTGVGVDHELGQGLTLPLSNNIIEASFNNFTGISQSVQNSGVAALTQQQVSFQGDISLN
ncbi:MAG TPA: hypothetical protein EYP95_02875 [Nitrospinaceae bacterium]|nr:hypothetical protein [Nitrospinaceae bacterium]